MLRDGSYKAEMCTIADMPVIPPVVMTVAMIVMTVAMIVMTVAMIVVDGCDGW